MAVPDIPLFTVMASELSDRNVDKSISFTGGNNEKYCSLGRKKRREKNIHKQCFHKGHIQNEYPPSIKTGIHNSSRMAEITSGSDPISCTINSRKLRRKDMIAELEKLRKENETLKKEGNALHIKLSEVENERDEFLKETENLTEIKLEEKNLQEDVFMLKNLVLRLNIELERAQDKLHGIKHVSDENSPTDDEAKLKSRTNIWGRSEMRAVAPLLQAYQDSLEDKEQLISKYRKEMEQFTSRCKIIVAENESLHQQLNEANKKGEITYTEWQSVQMEAAMTRDQNELLLRQAKLNENKLNDIHSAYQSKINEITINRDQVQERFSKQNAEMLVLKGKLSVLEDECEKFKSDATKKIPISVHKAAIEECRRMFEELKQRYEFERETLIRQVASLESNKPDLQLQLINVTAERDHLITEKKVLENLNKRLEERVSELEKHLKQCEKNRDNCKNQLTEAVKFARELIEEQELLVSELAERRNVVKIGTDIAARVGNLRHRLKGVERDACKELDDMEQKFKQQIISMDKMKGNFHKEINKLKAVIEEKDSVIQQLKSDKSNVDEQLEIVWKAALNENIDSREKLE